MTDAPADERSVHRMTWTIRLCAVVVVATGAYQLGSSVRLGSALLAASGFVVLLLGLFILGVSDGEVSVREFVTEVSG